MTGLPITDNFEGPEGRRCYLIEGESQIFPGWTEKNREYGSQDSWDVKQVLDFASIPSLSVALR